MTLLGNTIPLLPVAPINMQTYAKALFNGSDQNTNFYANATIYSQLNINIISLNFTNSWPFSFTTGQLSQMITENIPHDFGYLSSYSITNMVRLTTKFHLYLDDNLLLIFFVDDGEALLGSFIAPGLIDYDENAYVLNNIEIGRAHV